MEAPHTHTRPHFPPAFSADGTRQIDVSHVEMLLGANADSCGECEIFYTRAVLTDPPEVLAHVLAMGYVALGVLTNAIGARLGVGPESARQALTDASALAEPTRKAFSALQRDPEELEALVCEFTADERSAALQDVLNTLAAVMPPDVRF